jgi:hypothetical protein
MILAAQHDQDFDPTNLIQANTLPADEGRRIAANVSAAVRAALAAAPNKGMGEPTTRFSSPSV